MLWSALPVVLVLSVQSGDDLAAGARAAFAAKCVQCHGPRLPRPKSGFGFVTDLARLAASPKYIVPGDPDGSFLWRQIAEGEMPPDNAKAGPLTDAERDAVQGWIRSGAPVPTSAGPGIAPGDSTDIAAGPGARTPFARALDLVGRLHVVVIHFPIALLAAAAAGELWAWVHRRPDAHPATGLCLNLGAVAAIAAAAMGWLHAPRLGAGPVTILGLHRWLGTGVGVAAPVAALWARRRAVRGSWTPLVRGAICALATLAALAGHFGGLLTHGADFLDP
jgi:mono/diheme cytochrome c family protein/uncharacterized membrane protein